MMAGTDEITDELMTLVLAKVKELEQWTQELAGERDALRDEVAGLERSRSDWMITAETERSKWDDLRKAIVILEENNAHLTEANQGLGKRLKARPLAVTAEVMEAIEKVIYKAISDVYLAAATYALIKARLEALPVPEPPEKAEPPNAPRQEATFTYDSRMGQEKAEPPADLLALVDEEGVVEGVRCACIENNVPHGLMARLTQSIIDHLKRQICKRGEAAPAFDARELLERYDKWLQEIETPPNCRDTKYAVNEYLKDNPNDLSPLEAKPPGGFSIEQIEEAFNKTVSQHSIITDRRLAPTFFQELKALDVKEPPPTYGMSRKWMLELVERLRIEERELKSCREPEVWQNATDNICELLQYEITATDIPEPPAEKPNKCPKRCCFTCLYSSVYGGCIECQITGIDDGDTYSDVKISIQENELLKGCPDYTPIKEDESDETA